LFLGGAKMKSVVIDALSGRQVLAGDEETEATQPFVFFLTQRLGWNPKQIITRPQWRVPRTPSGARAQGFPVDIAIFDQPERVGDPDHVRILVECKEPDAQTGVGQLKTYLGLEPEARLGIWFNGSKHILVYKTADGFTVSDYAPVPRPSDPLSLTTGRTPLRYAALVPPPNLGEIFSRLRDQIAAQDTHVNRDEFILNDLANLLICKIADEQASEVEPERPMAFQLMSSRHATAEAIRRWFKATRDDLRSVFVDDSDELHVDDASIENVVKTLERYRLTGHDRHAVGTAFQVLRGRALKGDEGAYFTPPPVVDCVVSIVDPHHDDKLIDPACGTGGFLAAALDHVFAAIDNKPGASARVKEEAKRRWAKERLFAVDKDAVSVKLCKAYLTLLGDGRAHAYRANTIDRREWLGRSDDLKREVTPSAFNIVITNPPFGKRLKVSAEVGAIENLHTCRKWKRGANGWEVSPTPLEQQIGLAFFERGLDLLRIGGRMAIVLPETFLFSSNLRWFIDWVCRTVTVTHVVDVPMVAFEEFCRAKTCILFVTKEAPPPGHRIVMSYPRTIGQDKKGGLLRKVDSSGKRTGELDNEMAEAVQEIVGSTYTGVAKPAKKASSETRFRFTVPQSELLAHPVLVPRYWWRAETDKALRHWTASHPSEIVTLGELEKRGVIKAFGGHGSPPGHTRKTGSVPYVKVTDLKNWRINENPTNFIHEDVAAELRKQGQPIAAGDLVSPARASANIGQFCMVMPWQTQVVLTKEVLILRAVANDIGIDSYLLLALLSLHVVQDQYSALALMQTNREHLGDRWREVRVPLPASMGAREKAARPVREYFEGLIKARTSYDALLDTFGPDAFGTRP
jgi:type I restriction enzyme M protein